MPWRISARLQANRGPVLLPLLLGLAVVLGFALSVQGRLKELADREKQEEEDALRRSLIGSGDRSDVRVGRRIQGHGHDDDYYRHGHDEGKDGGGSAHRRGGAVSVADGGCKRSYEATLVPKRDAWMLLHDYVTNSLVLWVFRACTRPSAKLTHSSMSTLARNFCTRLPTMEGVADACMTDRSVRSPHFRLDRC